MDRNIILLGLSTLPRKGNIRLNDFRVEQDIGFGAKTITNCGSQLEPAVRMVLENTRNIDTDLIMLCTAETLSEVEDVIENDVNVGSFTALTYFFYRLKESGLISLENYEFLCASLSTERSCKQTVKEGEKNLSFHAILLNDNDKGLEFESINYAIDDIRFIYRNNKDNDVKLYFIANGGLRGFYLELNAIISILKTDNIEPYQIYSTVFNAGNSDYRVISEVSSFHLISFVAGMSDFITHGSVGTLEQYFTKMLGEESVKNDPLISAMKKIAEGTQFSDVSRYTEGLEELRDLLNNTAEKSAVMERPEFNMFRDTIIEDYGNLLVGDNYRIIDIVDRCRKKKMYQQALTFSEAKIYEDFKNYQILGFDEDNLYVNGNETVTREDERFRRFFEILEGKNGDKDWSHALFQRKYFGWGRKNVKSLIGNENTVCVDEMIKAIAETSPAFEEFLINKDKSLLKKAISEEFEKLKSESDNPFDFPKLYFEIKEVLKSKGKSVNVLYDDILRLKEGDDITQMSQQEIKCRSLKVKYTSVLPTDNGFPRLVAGIAINLWVILKLCRNTLNHGKERKFTMDQLDQVIRIFCTYCNWLFESSYEGCK